MMAFLHDFYAMSMVNNINPLACGAAGRRRPTESEKAEN
jgi:hypothetical protein